MESRRVFWDRGDNTRLAGKQQFHNRLAFDRDGRPRLYIFRTCPHFIRTVPSLVYSSVNVEDVDTSGEDHIYDASRYVLMSHPLPSSSSLAPGESTLGEDTLGESTLGAS